jgi:hypothetical protein
VRLLFEPNIYSICHNQVIIECQKHDDYQESLRWLLDFFERYVNHAKMAAKEGKDAQDEFTSVYIVVFLD